MNRREMEITIDRDGNVKVRVRGVKGAECVEFTKWLEEGLGEVEKRELTPDYYEGQAGIDTSIRG